MKMQVTIKSTTGKYKPVSAIVEVPNLMEFVLNKKEYQNRGILKICQKRFWTATDLKRYGYTRVTTREYNPEEIVIENAKRYEKIKEEKYASGEWKRPKNK